MKNNKVSVIIPCYNDGKYLIEAIESVEKCDKNLYEIIIVDDGSTDKFTKNLMNILKKKEYKIIKIKHQGQCKARNIGAKLAKYDYLLFLDSDNKICPEYIPDGIGILNKYPDIGVVYGDRHEFGLSERVVIQKYFDISEIIFENYIDTCAVIRKKVWQDCRGFDINLSLLEDWEFWINAHKQGWKFYHIPKVMFFYRLKKKSVNLNFRIRRNRLNVLEYIYKKHYNIFIDNFEKKLLGLKSRLELESEFEIEKKRIEELSNEILTKDIQINGLKNEIESIELSLTWKILKRYQNFVDRVLPPYSRIRRTYDTIISFNQNYLLSDNKKKLNINKMYDFHPRISKNSILLITNRKLSGGSILYEKKWIFENEIDNNIIVLDYEGFNRFRVYFKNKLIDLIKLKNYDNFKRILMRYRISSIFINQLAGIPDLRLIDYIIKSGINYKYYIHDFYCLSLYPHLIDNNENYLMDDSGNFLSINKKRKEKFENFIKNAQRVFVPSENTLSLIKKVYSYPNLEINPSPEISRFLNVYDINKTKPDILEIGIIGSIGFHKGSKIIKELVKLIEKENLPVKLKIVGILDGQKIGEVSKNLEIMGPYDKKNLQNILKNSSISFILFPSIWPETFSYVCQEAIELGYPILCFDIGSQVERIKNEKYGWKVDMNLGFLGIFKKIKKLEENRSLILKKAGVIKKDFPDVIDIIMPVYNGYSYLRKAVFSIIGNSDVKCNFIIIDDCSSDKRVSEFLKDLKSSNNLVQIKVIRNEKNLGFIQTVNKGLLGSKNHCVIVNSDIIVPENWLSRMITPLKKDSTISSITPYSNSGTICSFPEINKKNNIKSSSVGELDKVFRKAVSSYVEIPVGVGFCMLMNRNTINDIGYLDQDTFKRGYCEETDWCLRAKKAGWKNIHLQNLFIYHFERASFGSEAIKLSNINYKNFLNKHPDYEKILKEFLEKDPAKINRIKILNELKKEKIII